MCLIFLTIVFWGVHMICVPKYHRELYIKIARIKGARNYHDVSDGYVRVMGLVFVAMAVFIVVVLYWPI